jgi:uncharacterized membrane protein
MTGGMFGTEGWIVMGVWAAIMVVAVWLLVRDPRQEDNPDPSAILRTRYARGEISEGEFRRATAALDAEGRFAAADGAHPHGASDAYQGQETHHE